MQLPSAIEQLIRGEDLSTAQMQQVMHAIMTGEATDAQIGAFLVALRIKGESVEEIAGAARVMRSLAVPVQIEAQHIVDTCGTGGDGSKLFNVSTASAFVAAAAGATVAKHGNRSVSSRSGSADLLEAAGVVLDLSASQVAQCVQQIGVGFMFAPAHHGAMKHCIGPRRELATRTIFNLLGPLTNPAGAKNQVLGVYDARWLRPLAEVLKSLGSEHVMVVHTPNQSGLGGMDEISTLGVARVAELNRGEITEYVIDPADFGVAATSLDSLVVEDASQSLVLVKEALSDLSHPAAELVCLNAAAAIYVSGVADSYASGFALAQDAIGSGGARIKLQELVDFSRCLKEVGA